MKHSSIIRLVTTTFLVAHVIAAIADVQHGIRVTNQRDNKVSPVFTIQKSDGTTRTVTPNLGHNGDYAVVNWDKTNGETLISITYEGQTIGTGSYAKPQQCLDGSDNPYDKNCSCPIGQGYLTAEVYASYKIRCECEGC